MFQVRLRNEGTINKNSVFIQTEKGNLSLNFSHETIVGFSGIKDSAVSKNVWGKTTGKFLNELEPDKNKRIDDAEFQKRLNKEFQRLFISEEEITEKEI